jgi:hypothetical protein
MQHLRRHAADVMYHIITRYASNSRDAFIGYETLVIRCVSALPIGLNDSYQCNIIMFHMLVSQYVCF